MGASVGLAENKKKTRTACRKSNASIYFLSIQEVTLKSMLFPVNLFQHQTFPIYFGLVQCSTLFLLFDIFDFTLVI
jgi:hypothetical protein